MDDLPGPNGVKRFNAARCEGSHVLDTVAAGDQHDDAKSELGDVLLVFHIAISHDKRCEPSVDGAAQEFAIAHT